jgi:type I restriction enzyme R subunit
LELILKIGIADAIDTLPEGIKRDRRAVAETIANNVRSKILKSHLLDPAYYDRMSVLLGEILVDLREKRSSYEDFLRRIAELIKDVEQGHTKDVHAKLSSPGKRALFNLLKPFDALSHDEEEKLVELVLKIDQAVKKERPSRWRGVDTKEKTIKNALFGVVPDHGEVERIFVIIKAHTEY